GRRARLPDHRCVERHRRRHRAPCRAGGLSPRAGRALDGEAPHARRGARRRDTGARRHLRRRGLRPAGGDGAGRAGRLRPPRRRVRQRRLRRHARVSERDARALARHGAHERPRLRVHDPRDDPGPEGVGRPPAADELRRRAPAAAGVALQRHEARRHGDGRGRAPGAQRHRRARHVRRARNGRHAVLRQPGAKRPRARRHRARRHLRRLAATARRRQRDPDPPGQPADL
ncbi:MAG: Sepiapterin reductase, partial [uncultured Solirubrobacteraceae bacterium]